MTDIDTAALRALAEQATPGGWFAQEHRHWAEPRRPQLRIMYTATDAHNLGAKFSLASLELYGTGRGSDEDNAAFIAAASPDVVIGLLDKLAAVTAARDEALACVDSLTTIAMEAIDIGVMSLNHLDRNADAKSARLADLHKGVQIISSLRLVGHAAGRKEKP